MSKQLMRPLHLQLIQRTVILWICGVDDVGMAFAIGDGPAPPIFDFGHGHRIAQRLLIGDKLRAQVSRKREPLQGVDDRGVGCCPELFFAGDRVEIVGEIVG